MFHHWGFDMGWGGMLFQFFLWIAVVALALWAIIRFSSQGSDSGREEDGASAQDILNRRYARGEIDREEYEQKKDDLAHQSH